MFALSTFIFFTVLFHCHGRTIWDEQCLNDTIDFSTKVNNSSYVVYGKTIGKTLYPDNDSMFFVTFQVDCIFKGPTIQRHINITEAGRVKGRRYCQDFPVGRGYSIAFLEPNPSNINDTNTFVPADFVEVPFITNITNELLANTCGLHQSLPMNHSATITDVCPAVSTAHQCIPTTIIGINLISNGTDLHGIIIPNGGAHIRSKSGVIQVDVDHKNGVNLIHMNILLILMAMTFVRFN